MKKTELILQLSFPISLIIAGLCIVYQSFVPASYFPKYFFYGLSATFLFISLIYYVAPLLIKIRPDDRTERSE